MSIALIKSNTIFAKDKRIIKPLYHERNKHRAFFAHNINIDISGNILCHNEKPERSTAPVFRSMAFGLFNIPDSNILSI